MELLSSQNKTVPHPPSVDWLQFQCFFDLDFIYSWECRQNECELDFVSRGIIGVSRGVFFALTDIRVHCSCHPLLSQGLCELWVGAVSLECKRSWWSGVLESAKDHDGAVFLRVQKIMMEGCSWECKRSWCSCSWECKRSWWSGVLESAKDHDGVVFLRVQKIMMLVFLRVQKIMMLVMLVCFVVDEEELQPIWKANLMLSHSYNMQC
jgi:hypothetical protein